MAKQKEVAKEEPKAPKSPETINVQAENGLVVAVPAFLEKYMGTQPEFTKDDLIMPRLSLAQGLSPQLNPEKPEFIDGLRLGDAFNTATNHIYGRGPWEVAFIRVDKPRWVEFIPREQGGGIKDPNVPYNDPRTQFGEDGSKPKATQFRDYIMIFLDTKESIALSFKSTGIRVAKKLNTLIAKRGAIPLFMGKYKVRAVMTPSKKGDYATLSIMNDGFVTDTTMLQFLATQFEVFKDKPIVIEREPGQDDDEEPEL